MLHLLLILQDDAGRAVLDARLRTCCACWGPDTPALLMFCPCSEDGQHLGTKADAEAGAVAVAMSKAEEAATDAKMGNAETSSSDGSLSKDSKAVICDPNAPWYKRWAQTVGAVACSISIPYYSTLHSPDAAHICIIDHWLGCLL
jgi:hypothetical protein